MRSRVITLILITSFIVAPVALGASACACSSSSSSCTSDSSKTAASASPTSHLAVNMVPPTEPTSDTHDFNQFCHAQLDEPIAGQPTVGRIGTFVAISCSGSVAAMQVIVALFADTGNGFPKSTATATECDASSMSYCELDANCYAGRWIATVSAVGTVNGGPVFTYKSTPIVKVTEAQCQGQY